MTLVQAKQLMDQGIMIKHPHCNGHVMMNGGSINIHRKDGKMVNLGNPNDVIPILSNTMTDDWDIVTMMDVKLHKEAYDELI